MRALSRRYWQLLACRLWQEDCEEEVVAEKNERMRTVMMEEEEEEEEERGGTVIVEHQGKEMSQPFLFFPTVAFAQIKEAATAS